MTRLPLRYWPVSEWAQFGNFARGSGGDDLAAVDTRTRTDVDDVVGRVYRVLVVFDDDHGIAEVAQEGQGLQQAIVVALMQADRRLVEDVHDADQPGADLAGQANALGFAAGQGFRAAATATGSRDRR